WKLQLPILWLIEEFAPFAEASETVAYAPHILSTTIADPARASAVKARTERFSPTLAKGEMARVDAIKESLGGLIDGAAGSVIHAPVPPRRIGPDALACPGASLTVALAGGS